MHYEKQRHICWRRYKIQETSYIGQWRLRPFKVGTLGPHTVLPTPTSHPIVLSWILSMVWNLFPFNDDFSFGKSQKLQGTKSELQGGWITWVIWCFTKKLCMRCYALADTLSWWSCQSPVAHICGLLNHPNHFYRGMFKLNAKFDGDLSLYLLSHFECDSHTVHMLTQWRLLPPLTSTVKLSLFTHMHSSPLSLATRLHQCHENRSLYVNNGWTFSKQTLYIIIFVNLVLLCLLAYLLT